MVTSLLGADAPETGTTDAPAGDAPSPVDAPVTPDDEQAGGDHAPAEGGDGEADSQVESESLLHETLDDLTVEDADLFPNGYLENTREFAKEHDLSVETARALVERDRASREADKAAWESEKADWVKRVKADPDLGGDKLPTTIQHAKAALHRYFPPEFATMLDRTGFGNHPDLIRGLARIGSLGAESQQLVHGNQSAPKGGTWATDFANSGAEPGVQ